MNKKYLISILILIIAILLIIFGIFFPNDNEKTETLKTPTDNSSSNNTYTYEEAKELGEKLYKDDNNNVEVTQEQDGYHIIIKDSESGKRINELTMDENGNIISESPSAISNGGEIIENE